MDPMDRQDFDALKRALELTYRQAFPAVTAPIETWKGEEITRFQEELTTHVHGRVSEKWFYTHIKGAQNALPRRSVLDMLSRYTGAVDWQDFRNGQREPNQTPAAPAKKRQRLPWVMGGAVLLVLTGTLYAALGLSQQHTFQFCFVNADRNQPITDGPIAVLVLEDGQSPVYQACDAQGCIQLQTARDQIRFAVHAPYFRKDTITRFHQQAGSEEVIRLYTDDYALMIHYFSTNRIQDWQKRRAQLKKMITPGAEIIQVHANNTGMELYNREEFIDKLTMPLKSLRNIEIVETRYKGNRIDYLRFLQKPTP